jgi:hypothetical protein
MYTSPQMPHEALPEAPKEFASLWSMSVATFKTWKEGWGIFSLINLGIVVIGTIAWGSVVTVMPWLKTFLKEGKSIDPAIIAAHYPTTATLITDLALICAILIGFIICIFISQIMTIHAINPETRHKGLKHLFLLSLQLLPKYMLTSGLAGLIVLGGVALLLIPGMLLLPLALVTVYIAALEQKTGMEAVVQGSHYIKGYIIEALWRTLVVIIIIHVVSLLLPLLAALLVYPFTLLNFSKHTIDILSFIAGTLYTFISFILSLVLPSLLIVFYFHIYSHMKDHPTSVKPIHPHILKILAIVGAALVVSLLLLETFGI